MPQMIIRIKGQGGAFAEVFRDKQILNLPESIPIRIETLDHGMQSGEPSVAIILEMPREIKNTVVLAQTSLKLFQQAAAAMYAKYGDRTGGAFLASYKGGSVRLVTSPEINCPNCKADLPGTCKFCFECGHPLSKDSTSGAGKTYTLPPLPVKIIREAPDPECPTRVSIGGGNEGYYCVYRGGLQDCIRAIRQALRSMQEVQGEPPISPDEGKKYA